MKAAVKRKSAARRALSFKEIVQRWLRTEKDYILLLSDRSDKADERIIKLEHRALEMEVLMELMNKEIDALKGA